MSRLQRRQLLRTREWYHIYHPAWYHLCVCVAGAGACCACFALLKFSLLSTSHHTSSLLLARLASRFVPS